MNLKKVEALENKIVCLISDIEKSSMQDRREMIKQLQQYDREYKGYTGFFNLSRYSEARSEEIIQHERAYKQSQNGRQANP